MAEYAQCSMDHWRMVVTSMEGSLHLQSMQSMHSVHSVQGGMDQWRGESLAGGTTYLMAHYKSPAMRHLQFAKVWWINENVFLT